MGEYNVNLISVLCKLLFHISLDVRRGLFIRKPRPAPCKAIIFIHTVRPANGDASLFAEAIDFAIFSKENVGIFLFIPFRRSIPLPDSSEYPQGASHDFRGCRKS